jgi:hypothetical protein
MPDSRKAMKLVVGLLVFGLLTAFLLPVAIGAISGDETTSITQTSGDTTEVQPDLSVTLDSVTADTDATYTVNANGSTATTSALTSGSSETVTVDGVEVTVTPTNIDGSTVTTDVAYPTSYGWGTGAGAMWGLLPVIIVLAAFLYLVGYALMNYNY